MSEGDIFIESVEIVFADGRTKTVDKEIMLGGEEFTDCAESSSFPVGVSICKTMTLTLDNTEEQWKEYDFFGAKVNSFLKMQIDESNVEIINKGSYTVTIPEQYGEIIEFTAIDDMYKANAEYKTNLTFPQPAFTVLRDACSTCGITLGVHEMDHGDVLIHSIPDKTTFRQIIGWIAMIETANARIDVYGELQFVKWNLSEMYKDYSASVDSEGFITFGGGSTVDAEDIITPVGMWYVDINGFLNLEIGEGNPQRFYDYISIPKLSSDDIVITGIRIKNANSEYLYGKEGYVLEFENDILEDSALQTVAGWIGDNLIGNPFRTLDGEIVYNPLVEFGDVVFTYDEKGNKYITPMTDITSSLNGITNLKTQAEDPIRTSSKFNNPYEKTKAEVEKLVEKEKAEREKAVEILNKALADSSGMYETVEILEDGSSITYMHDKKLLAESKNVIKITAEAVGVSNDGGKTYPYGFRLTGEIIASMLYAKGIDANFINTGALTVKDKNGNIVFSADMTTGKVLMGASVQIGDDASIGDIYQKASDAASSAKNAQTAAENAQTAAEMAKNLTAVLSNEYQAFPVDENGNYSTFPSEVKTTVTVMYGSTDVTNDCSISAFKSDNITGSFDDQTFTYTVTGLSGDTGWVDLTCVYLGKLQITKRFSIAKQYAGKHGEQGIPGKTYFIELSENVLIRENDNIYKPSSINVYANYIDGDGNTGTYNGQIKIQVVAADGSEVSSSMSYAPFVYSTANISEDASLIRFTLFKEGTSDFSLDVQTIPILSNISLTHEDIFNLLTKNGTLKGIYKEGNELYISFTYAKGGTLKLGGSDDGYGELELLDDRNSPILKVNRTDGLKNINGNEWIQIIDSIIRSGYSESIDGLLDLSAQYPDDVRNVVLEALTFNLLLKAEKEINQTAKEKWSATSENGAINLISKSGIFEVTDGNFWNRSKNGYAKLSADQGPVILSGQTTVFENIPISLAGNGLLIDSEGEVTKNGSSSARYKDIGKRVNSKDIKKMYDIDVVWARYKDGYLSENDERNGVEMPMFLAENIDSVIPVAVDHINGLAENWNHRVMIPMMFAMIKDQHEQIERLQSEIKDLRGRSR